MSLTRGLAALLMAVLVALAGGPASPRAAEPIRVGIAMPLTGSLAASGARNVLAATTAIDALNASGGVLGRPVQLVAADDGCGTEAALDAAGRLVEAGVVMVVGHLCSHSSLLAAAIYDSAGILMLMPESTHPRLTEENRPNVFRLIGRDDDQGAAAAALIAERWPGRRLALLDDGTLYGQQLARETGRALARRRVEVALAERYAQSQDDYGEVVRQLGETGIEVVFIAGYGPDAGRLVADADRAGLRLQVVGGDGLGLDEFLTAAGKAADGTVFGSFRPQMTGVEAATARPDLEAAFATGGLGAYAAIELWSEAVARAGSLALGRVAEALHRGRFATVRGTLSFDAKGDLEAPGWTWRVWRDGRAVPLE